MPSTTPPTTPSTQSASDTQKVTLQYKYNDDPINSRIGDVKGTRPCPDCKGSGSSGSGKKKRACSTCKSEGILYLVNCPDCFGTGVNSKRGPCSTCKGERTISSVRANEILNDQDRCAEFKENPAKVLGLPIACLAAIAFTSGPVWRRLLMDVNTLFNWNGALPGFIFLVAFYFLCRRSISFFRGSKHDADRFKLRLTGTVLILLGFVVMFVAGPARVNEFDWMEEKVQTALNETDLRSSPIKCYEVVLDKKSGYTYYGTAKLTNKTRVPVVARYETYTTGSGKHRRTHYRIYVDLLEQNNN